MERLVLWSAPERAISADLHPDPLWSGGLGTRDDRPPMSGATRMRGESSHTDLSRVMIFGEVR
jgi:hypothetical protein